MDSENINTIGLSDVVQDERSNTSCKVDTMRSSTS